MEPFTQKDIFSGTPCIYNVQVDPEPICSLLYSKVAVHKSEGGGGLNSSIQSMQFNGSFI